MNPIKELKRLNDIMARIQALFFHIPIPDLYLLAGAIALRTLLEKVL